MKHYYAAHVFFDRRSGYTVGIESDKVLTYDEEIIAECLKQGKFSDESDAKNVNETYKISQATFIMHYNN